MLWFWFDCRNILGIVNIRDLHPGDYEYDPHRNGYWVKPNSRTAIWLALKGIPHWTGTRPFDHNV